jgi:hypothetical protein
MFSSLVFRVGATGRRNRVELAKQRRSPAGGDSAPSTSKRFQVEAERFQSRVEPALLAPPVTEPPVCVAAPPAAVPAPPAAIAELRAVVVLSPSCAPPAVFLASATSTGQAPAAKAVHPCTHGRRPNMPSSGHLRQIAATQPSPTSCWTSPTPRFDRQRPLGQGFRIRVRSSPHRQSLLQDVTGLRSSVPGLLCGRAGHNRAPAPPLRGRAGR